MGEASFSSTVSGNLNTGTVRTNSQYTDAGGAVGFAWSNSKVSGNLNTGTIRTSRLYAFAGGAVGEASSITVRGNLNTGSVSTNGGNAFAGGAVGSAENSPVSGNLNTGTVRTSGENAFAGGAVGKVGSNSPVNGNLNLNDEAINAAQANESSQIGHPPNNNALSVPVNGLGVLNGTLWTAGNDGQFPMLKNINAAYQDLRRINNDRYGNNTFPIELSMFAPPRNDTSESLFNPGVWNVREGYLPFLKSMGRTRAQAAGIDCTRGGFACGCDFTDQSPGTIEHLLYDGQRYHAVVKTDSGLAYWTTYEKDGSLVPLGSCGVYEFTDPLLSGTDHVVEAVINRGDSIYVAFHAPETQPVNPMLAMLTLSNEQPSPAMALLMSPNDRVVSLSVDEPDVLVNTGQAVYRLSGDNGLTVGRGNHALRANEAIQSVAGNNGDLYFLTHELETGYRLRVVPAVGAFASIMVTTSSGLATSKPLITSLNISDGLLHLLVIDGSSVIWKKYKLEVLEALEGLDNTPEEAQESEVLAILPPDISPTAITFIPEMDVNTDVVQDQVFVLGKRFNGLPQYARLQSSDFINKINNLPLWAKTVLGTGVSVTVFATLATFTSCLIWKAWSRYKYSKGRLDFIQKDYQ